MSIERTFDLLDQIKTTFPKNDILASKVGGKWIPVSSSDYYQNSHFIAAALYELGYRKGDHILTVSNSSPEWNFFDMAMAMLGIIHVPVYPSLHEEEYIFIFKHSDAKAIIVGDKILYQRVNNAVKNSANITSVYCIQPVGDILSYSDMLEMGKKSYPKLEGTINEIKDSIKPDDFFTMIYTSGTTGQSKGVMLTHHNMVTNFKATSLIQPLNHTHKILSFLPICHVFERMLSYHYQFLGIGIYYAENIGTIGDNLREIKADGMTSVPRLLEGIHDKLVSAGKDLTGIKKKIFFWALDLAFKYEVEDQGWWYNFKFRIADKLVYKRWKAALGGNLRIVVCGGSSMQVRLLRLFWAIDVFVIEGYGLTETSPVLSCNTSKAPNVKFGTVGKALDGVILEIDETGEILAKGPNVMKGYYKDEEYTKQVIDADGWFHTGDIGQWVDGDFLKITDRKKEIFKNSGGKYIAPQILENKCKESIFIEQIIVVGENEKYAAALISPNFNYLHFWALKHKIHYRDNLELLRKPEVIARIQREISQLNKGFSPHEQIRKFRLVPDEWTSASGALSPTLKLKRKFLYEKYDALLKEMYSYAPDEVNRAIK